MKIVVYCDGLCEPYNPNGIATYGFVIYKDGIKIYEESRVIGEGFGMSNNLAEYSALCEALWFLISRRLNDEKIIVKSDSRLLINQMNRWWKCHGGLYINKYKEALMLSEKFSNLHFVWIPREENYEADTLSRNAYEEYCKEKGIEPKYHKKCFYYFKGRK